MIKTAPRGYRPLRELARGGMGVVHLAVDQQTGQQVALKTLFNADPEEVRRWQQELRAGQALAHPGIAKVIEAGVSAGGQPWLAMELVPGESLKQKLDREGPLPPDEVARIGREIAQTLVHAHEQGIIHRDLKPANVILRPDGQPVVIDLGLVKILNTDLKASRSLSQTGEIMGTPAFMAPEQARGDRRAIGPWTDVWGLGATLYQLATGELPFQGKSGIEVLEGVLDRPPVPPRSIRPEIPERLEAVILRCLEKEPKERWASAEELVEGLVAAPVPARDPAVRLPFPIAFAVAVVAAAMFLVFGPERSLKEPLTGTPAERARLLIPERMEERIYGWTAQPELARLLLERAEAALELEPDYVSALIVKAGALEDLGRGKEAVEALDHAIQLDPRSRIARLLRRSANAGVIGHYHDVVIDDMKWLIDRDEAPAVMINEYMHGVWGKSAWPTLEEDETVSAKLKARIQRPQYLDSRPNKNLTSDAQAGSLEKNHRIYKLVYRLRQLILSAKPGDGGASAAELADYQQRALNSTPESFMPAIQPFPAWLRELARADGLTAVGLVD